MSDFAEALAFGQWGESEVARMLTRAGHHVLPVYDVPEGSGKGPRLWGPNGRDLVAPDMLAFPGDGDAVYVEAKTKRAFTERKCPAILTTGEKIPGGFWETGIDLHHYEDYLKVAARTGIPVWLVFLHLEAEGPSAGFYWANLVEVPAHRTDGPRAHARHGMAYWHVDQLMFKRL